MRKKLSDLSLTGKDSYMKSYDELAERVFRKADERLKKKNIRMMYLKRFSITVSGMCAVILVMFGIWKNDSVKNALDKNFKGSSFITDESIGQYAEKTTAAFTEPAESSVTNLTESTFSSSSEQQETSIVSAAASSVLLPEISQTDPAASVPMPLTTTAHSGSAASETSATSSAVKTTSVNTVLPTTFTNASSAETTFSNTSSFVRTTTSAVPEASKTTSATATSVLTSSRVPQTSTTYRWTTTTTSTTYRWTTITSLTTAATSVTPTTTTTKPVDPPVVTGNDGNIPAYIEYPVLVREEPSLRPWYEIEPTTEYRGLSAEVSSEKVGGYIETVEISDRSLNGSVSADIYSVNKISPLVCVAVKIEGQNGYTLYRNDYYTPATLGDMINDMNLLEEAEFTSVEWVNIGENLLRDIHIGKETVFEMLFTDYSITNETNLEYSYPELTINLDIPILDKRDAVFFIGTNGCVQTTIVDHNAFFDIDKSNVESFLNYVLENNLYTESELE